MPETPQSPERRTEDGTPGKRSYSSPRLRDLGPVSVMTQAGADGTSYDTGTYPNQYAS